jgi:hypothetical protein
MCRLYIGQAVIKGIQYYTGKGVYNFNTNLKMPVCLKIESKSMVLVYSWAGLQS